jgi:hypothetical protein
MKRICLIFIIISAAAVLFAQSVWTGNAAVSNEKEFESYYSEDSSTGKYLGASNSFPGSTEVTITNPRNGKSVSVSIVKRLSQPGLFLVLSPEAGQAIELPDDDILNVEVVVRRKNEEVFNNYTDDLPYSEDPDLNPSAELAIDTDPAQTTSESGDFSPVSIADAPEVEPEIEPPVETSVNEYIPPVVLNNEGTPFEEGYDPLVVLEGEEEDSSTPEEIVEIIDDPKALAEAITSSVSEPDIPLPERYDESDLPESFDPEDLLEDTSPEVVGITPEKDTLSETLDNAIVLAEPGVLKPEELDSDFMEAGIDDLLISEPAESEMDISEPEISEIVMADPELEESDFDAIIIAEPEIEEILISEPEETETLVIEPIEDVEPITIEPITIEPEVFEPVVIAPETVEEEPENVIYFLTPGDFRPPPQSEEKKEKEKEKVKEKTIVALPVERSELEEIIVTELHNGGSYLQLGTYSSVEVLYSQIEMISDSYPSIVLTMGERDNQLYKLLIGPISRDEKGIVMTRFRSLGYGDAFLYTPR